MKRLILSGVAGYCLGTATVLGLAGIAASVDGALASAFFVLAAAVAGLLMLWGEA